MHYSTYYVLESYDKPAAHWQPHLRTSTDFHSHPIQFHTHQFLITISLHLHYGTFKFCKICYFTFSNPRNVENFLVHEIYLIATVLKNLVTQVVDGNRRVESTNALKNDSYRGNLRIRKLEGYGNMGVGCPRFCGQKEG